MTVLNRSEKIEAFGRLLDVLEELRDKCPWDKEQTMESLRTLSIEELFELSDAIMDNDYPNIKKELGDILLHIVFYSKIGEEENKFNLVEVINSLCEKLIYRHPHVFGDTEVKDSGEVINNWEQLKVKEKDGNKRILSGVPRTLPALIKASRMQEKAAAVGFDWEKPEQVWGKVQEERDELQKEIDAMDSDKMEAEFGDLFFSLVNAARLYGINPETALERTNRKFISRFTYIEEKTIRKGKNLKDISLEEMDVIWDEAKKLEK